MKIEILYEWEPVNLCVRQGQCNYRHNERDRGETTLINGVRS